jgi:FkbM family methyltransferase
MLAVLRDDEVFIDGGAYDGCVTEDFARRTGGAFRKIVAIEPDGPNRARLEAAVKTSLRDDARIAVRDFALAESDGEAPFHEGLGYASQLSATGGTSMPCRSLDALDLAPTFVKLHLEGGELAALKGAQQTLIENRPLIAATVYHNADGLWKTARWLMRTLPDYQFLFRIHSWCGTGAVIYGIPNERRAPRTGSNAA